MKKNHLTQLINLLLITCLLVVVSACDSNNNSEKVSVVRLPGIIQKLILPSGALSAWITIDGKRSQMTIDSVAGTASATITGLPRVRLDVLIEFEFTDSNQSILIASATRSVDLSAGSATISFVEADYYTSYDEDKDGLSNVDELASGNNPFGQPGFSELCFPLSIFSAVGNLAFDYNGDLLIANGSNTIRKLNHATCDMSDVISVVGEGFVGIVEDKLRSRVYAGSADSIFEINPDNAESTPLVNIGVTINSLALAPSSYGSFGGQLIAVTSGGQILAIDQSVTDPNPVPIVTVSGLRGSDIAFGNDGTLYATDYDAFKIVTVSADGLEDDFVIGISRPDGLAIDNSGSRLFFADSGIDDLRSASIPSGAASIGETSLIGDVDFSAGSAPSGLAYDNDHTLLMITAAAQIEARSITPFNTSCLPLSLTGVVSGIASYTSYASGDLLFTSYNTDELRVLNRSTCKVITLASNVSGSELVSVTYDPSLNMIYAGSSDNNIYAVNPVNGSSTILTAVVAHPNGLVVAPSGYGSFGGQLIVGLGTGEIYAIDQTQASPMADFIVDIGGAASDLVFGSDGTLYIADYDFDNILTLPAGGVPVNFTSSVNRPEGLAVDNIGGRLFVANSGDNTMKQISIPSGGLLDSDTAIFDNGFGVSGIFFDNYGTILMGLGDGSQTITALDVLLP